MTGLSFLLNCPVAIASQIFGKSTETDRFIKELFDTSLVIDGVTSYGFKGGKKPVPAGPGEFKKLTGINIGGLSLSTSLLDRLNAWLPRQKNMMLITRAGHIGQALKSDKFGIIYYVQKDLKFDGSLEPLEEWHKKGLRILQIAYSEKNELGGGSKFDKEPLTALGKRVVRRMNGLGMVVDVSHTGKRSSLDAIEASSKPVTANHANAEKLTGHSRNKSDEELNAIAGWGGVVGVTTIGRFLKREERKTTGIDDFVAHVDYMVNLIGIDHVGLASDCYLDGEQVYDYDRTDRFLNSFDRWRHVIARLHEKGYKKGDLQKIMGLNFLRVYKQILEP